MYKAYDPFRFQTIVENGPADSSPNAKHDNFQARSQESGFQSYSRRSHWRPTLGNQGVWQFEPRPEASWLAGWLLDGWLAGCWLAATWLAGCCMAASPLRLVSQKTNNKVRATTNQHQPINTIN